MEDFLEWMGCIFLIVLIGAIAVISLSCIVSASTKDMCVSNGYSKYVERLGETYCLKFDDGIISGIGLLDSEKCTVTALGISE